jgi:hypothetical protein
MILILSSNTSEQAPEYRQLLTYLATLQHPDALQNCKSVMR